MPKACGRFRRLKPRRKRGASLTRQLLTFARRQSVNPQPSIWPIAFVSVREVLDAALGGSVQLVIDVA